MIRRFARSSVTHSCDQVVNGFLEKCNEYATAVEDALHRINSKCAMNIRLEPRLDEPYLDMKQFISSVIRKWQRASFGWQMIQVCYNTWSSSLPRFLRA